MGPMMTTFEPQDRPGGVPVIKCPPDAPARRMTSAELRALEQESQVQEDFERMGVFSRGLGVRSAPRRTKRY